MSTFRSQTGKTVIRMDILPPDHANRTAPLKRRRGDVIDAQFVTIRDGHRRGPKPRSHNDNRSAASSQSFAKRTLAAGERALMGLSADFFSAMVAVVFVTVFGLMGGFTFLFGGTGNAAIASPALDITHVTMTPQDANGMRILLINGIVENRSGESMAMPAIRADLVSSQGVVATTLISPPSFAIAAGHSRGFTARVPHPGGKTPDLRLSLTDRGA